MSGSGIEVEPNPTEVTGTDIEFVPKLEKCSVGVAAVPATAVRLGTLFAEQIPPVYHGTYTNKQSYPCMKMM